MRRRSPPTPSDSNLYERRDVSPPVARATAFVKIRKRLQVRPAGLRRAAPGVTIPLHANEVFHAHSPIPSFPCFVCGCTCGPCRGAGGQLRPGVDARTCAEVVCAPRQGGLQGGGVLELLPG